MAHLPGKRAFFTEPPMFERGCPTAAHPPVTIRRQGSLRGKKKKKRSHYQQRWANTLQEPLKRERRIIRSRMPLRSPHRRCLVPRARGAPGGVGTARRGVRGRTAAGDDGIRRKCVSLPAYKKLTSSRLKSRLISSV